MGTFPGRIRDLVHRIGHGGLVGRVEFDQVYAHYQEVNDQFDHPRGGQAHYLGGTLLGVEEESFGVIAKELLIRGPVDGMIDATENLAEKAEVRAPWEKSNLRNSAHPTVHDDGELVYDREPDQHRLTDEEIHFLDEERMAEDPKFHHPYGLKGLSPEKQAQAIYKKGLKGQAAVRASRKKAGRPGPKSAPRIAGGSVPPPALPPKKPKKPPGTA
jgi:hypothetical protein